MELHENHGKGTRKLDRGYYRAKIDSHEWNGLPPGVTRGDIMRVIRRIGPSVNISPELIHRLDTLVAISKDQDWNFDSKPVVSPHNDWLMKEWDLSKSQVQRTLASMQDLGLLVAKDSPSGRRYFSRDKEGNLIEAYGFDLSPLVVRYEELLKKLELREAEFANKKALKKKFTVIRREISALFLGVDDGRLPYLDLNNAENTLLSFMERNNPNLSVNDLENLVDSLEAFQASLENEIENLILEEINKEISTVTQTIEVISNNKLPNGSTDATPILNTNNPSNYKSRSRDSQRSGVCENNESSPSRAVHLNKSPSSNIKAALDRLPDTIKHHENSVLDKNKTLEKRCSTGIERIRPKMVASAANPSFKQWILTPDNPSWSEIIFAGQQTAKSLNLTDTDWKYAASRIGPHAASVAIMVMACKESQVSNIGGYLKGMLKKANTGQLHLHKSILGILAQNNNRNTSKPPTLL